ncbi:MAG: hypothetical protein QOF48_606, partial [Verrucomicrobiota bacterium]
MMGFGVVILLIAVVILIARQRSAARDLKELQERLSLVEDLLHQMQNVAEAANASDSKTAAREPALYPSTSVAFPPPLPSKLLEAIPPRVGPAPEAASPSSIPIPPILPLDPAGLATSANVPAETPGLPAPASMTWENFLGIKLFAWVGGLALFLGVAFFIKWSFDRNLITPLMRVVIGAVTGLGLIGLGLRIPRARYLVMVQTLCATGIVILYADCFAAHAYYQFIGVPLAFALMAVITASAFALAVKLDAQVIAVLGLLGGFLT